MRQFALQATELERASAATMRCRLLKIGAAVRARRTARSITPRRPSPQRRAGSTRPATAAPRCGRRASGRRPRGRASSW
ncbi:MAG: hypothetical protein KIT60_04380 [Burkholderiaceae bacterium]|nr:hypothetical protein [Burkholderiaceae bacterium]